jgi:nitrate reductase gamma subunit
MEVSLMTCSELLIGGVLPYLAGFGFLAGLGYRLVSWRRAPPPPPMTLYPTLGSGPMGLVKQALFFPGLYRSDRILWFLSWTFHAFLALALLGHLRVATGLIDRLLASLGIGSSGVAAFSAAAGSLAGIVLLATVAILLARRLVVARAREISGIPDFFALLLLLAVVVSGDLMRLGGQPIDLIQTRAWAVSLLSFSPVVPSHPAFLLHVFCAEVLILYMAFSKLMHFGGIFFTLALIKKSAP